MLVRVDGIRMILVGLKAENWENGLEAMRKLGGILFRDVIAPSTEHLLSSTLVHELYFAPCSQGSWQSFLAALPQWKPIC